MRSFLLLLIAAAAASSATLRGTIVDAETGRALPRVSVKAPGTAALSGEGGRFEITVPDTGTITLTFAHLGYEVATQTLSASSSPVRIGLTSQFVEIPGLRVTAQRQGQASALNQQKNADNILNVVSSDLIGRFPDQNSAEAIQRVPGATVDRDQGEGRYVSVRGTEPRLTAVKINGQEVPSPEGDIRNVALDVIPADQLSSIEVHKSLTPEMDGDAIGGSVNLVTRVARDTVPAVTASLAGGYNAELASAKQLETSLGFSQRFLPGGALGLAVSGSYSRVHRGSDNSEMEWGDVDLAGGGEAFSLQTLELRDYEVTRTRLSVGTSVDYRLGAGSELYASGLFSRFDDQEYRRLLAYALDDGEYQTASTVTDANLVRELKDRYEVQDIWSVTAGGRHAMAGLKLDYSANFSLAEEREEDAQYSVFEQEGVDMAITGGLPSRFPRISVTGGDPYDASAFELKEFERADNRTTDRNTILAINLEKPLDGGSPLTSVKGGLKARLKEKDRDNDGSILEWDGNGTPTLADMVGGFEDDDFLGGKYKPGRAPSPSATRDFFNANRDSLALDEDAYTIDNLSTNYKATENVYAGYLQAKGTWGRLSALAGARYEFTDLKYTGNRIDIDTNGDISTSSFEASKSYGHLLPMAQARYTVTENAVLRAALTQSLARPHYYDLVPYSVTEDGEAERGNPDLKPTVAVNADLMAEYYLRPLGVVSAGVFAKFLRDPIYTSTFDEGDLEVTQPVNGKSAQVYGLEAAWMQQFTFLPGPLNGLGIYSNYTFTQSEAEIAGRSSVALPGQSDHTANVALTYEKYGFSGRIALNYSGTRVMEVGDEAAEDQIQDSRTQIDVSASQEVIPGLRVFAEILNVTDAPYRIYEGRKSQVIQQEYYSYWANVGVKYQF